MDRCARYGVIQKTPPTRESFEETVTVDFVRQTTGGSFPDARYILTVFCKATSGGWSMELEEVTPYDSCNGLGEGVGSG